jgi:hypothetical protein
MATKPILAALDVAGVQRGRFTDSIVLADYWALTKPEVNFLIAITTAAGLCLGLPAALAHFPWILLLHTSRHYPRGEWSRFSLNQLTICASRRAMANRAAAASWEEPAFSRFVVRISLSFLGVAHLFSRIC